MTVTLPESVLTAMQDAAAASNHGGGLSANRYAAAVIEAAVVSGIRVNESTSFALHGGAAEFSAFRDDSAADSEQDLTADEQTTQLAPYRIKPRSSGASKESAPAIKPEE